jgi:hypothetical protein
MDKNSIFLNIREEESVLKKRKQARELQEQLQQLRNYFREDRQREQQEDAAYAELLLGKAIGKPYTEIANEVMRKYSIDAIGLGEAIQRASNRHLERLQQEKEALQ